MKILSILVLATSLLMACGAASNEENSASSKTQESTKDSTEEMKRDTTAGISKEEQELLELLPAVL